PDAGLGPSRAGDHAANVVVVNRNGPGSGLCCDGCSTVHKHDYSEANHDDQRDRQALLRAHVVTPSPEPDLQTHPYIHPDGRQEKGRTLSCRLRYPWEFERLVTIEDTP